MITGESAGPFAPVSKPLLQCWTLGRHDGWHGLERSFGESALGGFVEAAHQEALDEASQTASGKDAELGIVAHREQQAERRLAELYPHMAEQYGLKRISGWARLTPLLYLALVVLAVWAEFVVSQHTVTEALSDKASKEQIAEMWRAGLLAVALMICVLGVSYKLLTDSLHHKGTFRFVEQSIAIIATVFSGITLYYVGGLREAIGSGDEALVLRWTGQTFMWVTWTLPCFAAAGLIVSRSHFRSYALHNSAVADIVPLRAESDELARQRASLEHELVGLGRRLEDLQDKQKALAEFSDMALSAYRHGYALGTEERAAHESRTPLYARLSTALGRRLPEFIRGPLR